MPIWPVSESKKLLTFCWTRPEYADQIRTETEKSSSAEQQSTHTPVCLGNGKARCAPARDYPKAIGIVSCKSCQFEAWASTRDACWWTNRWDVIDRRQEMPQSWNYQGSQGNSGILCPAESAAATFVWLSSSCVCGTGKLMLLTERERGFWNEPHTLCPLNISHFFTVREDTQIGALYTTEQCFMFHAKKLKNQDTTKDLERTGKKRWKKQLWVAQPAAATLHLLLSPRPELLKSKDTVFLISYFPRDRELKLSERKANKGYVCIWQTWLKKVIIEKWRFLVYICSIPLEHKMFVTVVFCSRCQKQKARETVRIRAKPIIMSLKIRFKSLFNKCVMALVMCYDFNKKWVWKIRFMFEEREQAHFLNVVCKNNFTQLFMARAFQSLCRFFFYLLPP